MLGQHGRGLTKALFTPLALAMARVGIISDMLTVAGTVLMVGVVVEKSSRCAGEILSYGQAAPSGS